MVEVDLDRVAFILVACYLIRGFVCRCYSSSEHTLKLLNNFLKFDVRKRVVVGVWGEINCVMILFVLAPETGIMVRLVA